jgi:hypothetical protein
MDLSYIKNLILVLLVILFINIIASLDLLSVGLFNKHIIPQKNKTLLIIIGSSGIIMLLVLILMSFQTVLFM